MDVPKRKPGRPLGTKLPAIDFTIPGNIYVSVYVKVQYPLEVVPPAKRGGKTTKVQAPVVPPLGLETMQDDLTWENFLLLLAGICSIPHQVDTRLVLPSFSWAWGSKGKAIGAALPLSNAKQYQQLIVQIRALSEARKKDRSAVFFVNMHPPKNEEITKLV